MKKQTKLSQRQTYNNREEVLHSLWENVLESLNPKQKYNLRLPHPKLNYNSEQRARALASAITRNDPVRCLLLMYLGSQPFDQLPNGQRALDYADSLRGSRAVSSLFRSYLQRQQRMLSQRAAIATAVARIRPPRDER